MNPFNVLISLALAASSVAFAGRPSQDATAASLQSAFRKAGGISSTASVANKAWNCYQFSAMQDIGANSTFTRTYNAFGGLLVTDAVFNGARSSGTVELTNGVLWGGITGTTDGFVFPYDSIAVYVRRQADGTLIEEWTADPRSMIMSLKHGLALSTLFAEQWMDPSVSDPNRVVFVYAVCRAQ